MSVSRRNGVPGTGRAGIVAICLSAAVLVPAVSAAAAPAGPSAAARPAVAALPPAATPDPGRYRSVPPVRLVDTRTAAAHPAAGTILTVLVTGRGGVPAAGVRAVFLHVTAAQVRAAGYLTAYPGQATAPGSSTLNFAPGQVSSNNALVAPGPDGTVQLRLAGGSADVIVDVLGWVTGGDPVPAGGLVPLTPTRLLDTRQTGAKLVATTPLVLPVSSPDLPPDASAVMVNVTTVNAPGTAPVTAWPAGTARPQASSTNTARGRPIATAMVVGLGSGHGIAFGIGSASTDLVIDLIGYVRGGQAAAGGLVPVTPVRALDTRNPRRPLAANTAVTVPLAGSAVPTGSAAAVITLTVLPTSGGYLVGYANGDPVPALSMLNPYTDVPAATQLIVPLGPDGALAIRAAGARFDIVVDVNGYLLPGELPPVTTAATGQADRTPLSGSDLESLATGVLRTTNRYALQTWWPRTAPALLATPHNSNAQSDSTDSIRRLSMQAFSLSIALATGGYDPAGTGTTAQGATQIVSQVAANVACSHRANRVGGWGSSWQSSMWSSYAGRAAWLVWGDVPAGTRRCVQRMVISEADFVSTLAPKYMVDRDGRVLTAGDTGAEEDAWYALAPALATAMMPTAEQRDIWRRAQQQMQIAAWARPSDTASVTTVDGTPLSGWLRGSNVQDSGVVVNHSRVAPDYSTNAYQNTDTLEMATLAGQPASQSTLFGIGPVYDALSTVSYVTPAYAAPGGTVYAVDSAQIYYPQGCDWGTGQQLPYALFDALADVYGLASTATVAPAAATLAHLGAAAAMQARTPSGAMYGSDAEYKYVGREEHTAQLAAQLYLAYFTRDRLTLSVTAQPVTPGARVAVPSVVAPPAPLSEHNLYR